MTRTVAWTVTVSAFLAAGTLHGQPPQPSFRSGVELVEVPVIVQDGKARMVSGLTRDDFRLLENGVPQTLTFFERVAVPVNQRSPRIASAVPRDVVTNDISPDARMFVIVLDGLHTAAHHVPAVKKYARDFIQDHVGPSDLVAVVSPGGLASATQDFTTDKARLLAAVDSFSGNKLRSATLEIEEERKRAFASGILLHHGRDPSDDEREYRVHALVSTLEALALHLGSVERRRKSLLLFSEGLDYNVGDLMRQVQRHASDVTAVVERGIAALTRASIVLYAIDARGLSSAEAEAVEAPIHGERRSNSLTAPGREGEFSESIRSLRHFSESTGGFAAVDSNDFGAAFDRILRESSEYYVLGYVPTKPTKPGEVRRLEVHVAQSGLRVAARKVYAARTNLGRVQQPRVPNESGTADVGSSIGGRRIPNNPFTAEHEVPRSSSVDSDLQLLLASPLPRPGLPLRLQAIPFRADKGKHAVTLVVELPGQALGFIEQSGRFEERVALSLLTVNDKGRAANGSSATLDLRLTADELDRVRSTGVRWLSRLSLPPGRHQIRVAAQAQHSNRSGLATYDLDLHRIDEDHVYLSGIALTSLPSVLMLTRGENKMPINLDVPPSTQRAFLAGDRVTFAVEAYPPSKAKADLDVSATVQRIDAASGGKAPMVQVPRSSQSRARHRGEQVTFAFDTASLLPGQYLLRVLARVTAGGDSAERVLPFEVLAK